MAVALTAVLAPADAGAAVTVGNDLSPEPTIADPCEPAPSCTLATTGLPDDDPRSPLDGVVVRWRVRASSTEPGGVPLRLQVIRDAGEGEHQVRSTSITRRFAALPLQTVTFITRQRVSEGDVLGLDVDPPAAGFVVRTEPEPGAELVLWDPQLVPGEVRAPTSTVPGEATFNADVEPDADNDGFGDETQDFCDGVPGATHGCETAAPETTITKAPRQRLKTRKKRTRVRFEFVSSEPGSTFRCVVDHKHAVACSSPLKRKLKRGKHSFSVQAIDPTGNADPTPAIAGFRVKRRR